MFSSARAMRRSARGGSPTRAPCTTAPGSPRRRPPPARATAAGTRCRSRCRRRSCRARSRTRAAARPANAPVALERRHDDLFLLADDARRRHQLRRIDEAAVVGAWARCRRECARHACAPAPACSATRSPVRSRHLLQRRRRGRHRPLAQRRRLLDRGILRKHQQLRARRRAVRHPSGNLVLPRLPASPGWPIGYCAAAILRRAGGGSWAPTW